MVDMPPVCPSTLRSVRLGPDSSFTYGSSSSQELDYILWRGVTRQVPVPSACTVSDVEIAERIRAQSTSLTAAERRVAEAILASPQAVGFGTVAELAGAANVGAASVVRLALKLGFDGYTDLQANVQRDLMNQLRPAAERIHDGEELQYVLETTWRLSSATSPAPRTPPVVEDAGDVALDDEDSAAVA